MLGRLTKLFHFTKNPMDHIILLEKNVFSFELSIWHFTQSISSFMIMLVIFLVTYFQKYVCSIQIYESPCSNNAKLIDCVFFFVSCLRLKLWMPETEPLFLHKVNHLTHLCVNINYHFPISFLQLTYFEESATNLNHLPVLTCSFIRPHSTRHWRATTRFFVWYYCVCLLSLRSYLAALI